VVRAAEIEQLGAELDRLAASTWHKIEVAPTRGLSFGEESITDHNLFDLDQRCVGVDVYKFNHTEEAGNGADFDWYIGDDVAGWIGLRFQAKKLDDGSYLYLGHRVDNEMQYDRLLRSSAADRMWPFYCFYNGWSGSWPAEVRNLTCDHPKNFKPTRAGSRGCKHADLEDFGCALAPAAYVAQRHSSPPRRGKLELDDYLAHSRPWSHLFGSLVSDPAQPDTAVALNRLISTLRGWIVPGPSADTDHQVFDPGLRHGPVGDGRRNDLPDYLLAARAGDPIRTGDDLPRLVAVADLGASGDPQ
jgi:hypothetical protein